MKSENSSWEHAEAGTRKYLSREITWLLYRSMDRQLYDVVMDGDLDCFGNGDEPVDVVVYRKQKKFIPCLAIEICTDDKLNEVSESARLLKVKYGIDEFLIYNTTKNCWYLIDEQLELRNSSPGGFLNIPANQSLSSIVRSEQNDDDRRDKPAITTMPW
jgi:hypothetical protein